MSKQTIPIRHFVKTWQPVLNVAALERKAKLPANTVSRHINEDFRYLNSASRARIIYLLSMMLKDLKKVENIKE
jgi:hypothetical protein